MWFIILRANTRDFRHEIQPVFFTKNNLIVDIY